ncbi:hypothetical protein LCGC14_1285190, partial [marine sediment metagenome]
MVARRSTHEIIQTTEKKNTGRYSVKMDEDKDGLLDIEMVYSYEFTTIERREEVTETTTVVEEDLMEISERLDLNDDNELKEFLTKEDYKVTDTEKEVLKKYAKTGFFYIRIESPLDTRRRLFKQFQHYSIFTSIDTSNLYVYEDLLFNEYELDEGAGINKLVESRHYKDNFIDQFSVYDINEKVMTSSDPLEDQEVSYDGEGTLTISENAYNTTLTIHAERATLFTIINISSINWDVETWGPDDVPMKFDYLNHMTNINREYIEDGDKSYYRFIDADITTESNIEKTIIISIANQYSLYYDYLNNDDPTEPITKFTVTGVFVTPKDGVYYSSQKELYSDEEKVKTDGHYLYYDSDLNGFYETVFILSPDTDEDGIYNVMSVGYNYDGIHDFIPYVLPDIDTGIVDATRNNVERLNTMTSSWKNINLAAIDIFYPKGAEDGWIVKDQIFEIEKIAKGVNNEKRYPELYREVKDREYAEFHKKFNKQVYDAIINQVQLSILPGVAALLVSTIPGYGQALAPIVYATIYFLETWSQQMENKAIDANLQKSRTFYDTDDLDKKGPTSLNEKLTRDTHIISDADEKHPNHLSAYYYTVKGGDPGKDYDAKLIIAPPRAYRGDGKTFKYYNLDYFLLTSGLAALERETDYIVDVTIGTTPKVYYGDLDDDQQKVVEDYIKMSDEERHLVKQTILKSHEELDVGEWTLAMILHDRLEDIDDADHIFKDYYKNTISALEQNIKSVSNNEFDTIRPFFENGVPDYRFVSSKDIELTQTLSPLYRPIIVSEAQRTQLINAGEYTQSELIINPQKVSSWKAYSEIDIAKGKKLRILLSNKGFEYPIDRITIGENDEKIDSRYYEVRNGYLYLSIAIPMSFADAEEMHIYFDTIVAGDSYSGSDTLNTNDETGRYALAQTLSYSISDYFNQFYIASTNAKKSAELEFTATTTIWSTFFSTLILLPLSVTVMAASSTTSTAKIIVSQLAKIPSAILEETFEELYLDPLIEDFFYTHISELTGSDNIASFAALLATSMREGFGGIGRFAAIDHSSQISQSALLSLSDQISTSQGSHQISASQGSDSQSDISLPFLTIFTGFSGGLGGISLGFAALGLDFMADYAVDIMMQMTSEQQATYSLDMDLATALAYQQQISVNDPQTVTSEDLTDSWGSGITAQAPLNDYAMQAQIDLSNMEMENALIIMRLKQENIKREQNELETIKDAHKYSDSDYGTGEIAAIITGP